LALYFKIKSAPWTPRLDGNYTNADLIKCTFNPIPSALGAARIPQFDISGSLSICATETNPSADFRLNEIRTTDYLDKIGFEIN
jgi:hypothetical protein